MSESSILVHLGLVIAGAALTALAGRRVGLPPILAYMVAGLVLGPATGLLPAGGSLELFSELGIALLLFLVGLELNLDRIRDVGATAAAVGVAQVALTGLAGTGLALALGFRGLDAGLVGLGVTFSSTVVVVKLLDRSDDLASLHGRLAVGVLLVQDVVVAVALTLLAGLAGEGTIGFEAVARGTLGAAAGIAGLGLLTWAGLRFLLPGLTAWLARSAEALFVVGLTWCFFFILLAEAFHLSIELGAFIAGVGLAQLPWGEDLQRRVHPLVDLFLAVFFVALAAGMDVAAIRRLWPAALILSAFAVVAKPALVTALLRRGRDGRSAFMAGLVLGQISEFSLVLAALAAGAGLAGPDLVPLLGLVALLTIAASALLVPRGPAFYRRLGGGPGPATTEPGSTAPPSGHVVVIGMNTLGRELARRFADLGDRVVAVDTDPAKLEGLPAETVYGSADNPAVLERARVGEARLVVSALRIQDVNALLAWRLQRLGVPVSIHAFDAALADELTEIGADHLMVTGMAGLGEMEAEVRRLGALG